jgi:hypothetical protein
MVGPLHAKKEKKEKKTNWAWWAPFIHQALVPSPCIILSLRHCNIYGLLFDFNSVLVLGHLWKVEIKFKKIKNINLRGKKKLLKLFRGPVNKSIFKVETFLVTPQKKSIYTWDLQTLEAYLILVQGTPKVIKNCMKTQVIKGEWSCCNMPIIFYVILKVKFHWKWNKLITLFISLKMQKEWT